MTGRLTIRSGYYNCVISYKDEYGKYKQKWIKTPFKERGNKTRAKEFLNQELLNFSKEMEERNAKALLGNITFLQWMESFVEKKKFEVSKVTYVGYKRTLNVIKLFFGKETKLKDITHTEIEQFFLFLKQERQNKNATVKYYSTVIYPALKQAYLQGYILKNPVDFMAPIKNEKTRHSYYNKKDLKKLFKVMKGHTAQLAIKIAAFYGLRRSELIGLKWQSIDFYNKIIKIENKLLIVEKEVISTNVLKTSASHRALPLLPEIEKNLKQHLQNIEKNKAELENAYNFQFEEFVFVNQFGNLLRPHYVSQSLRNIIKKHNLKKIRFHDLRHSCASLLLANGVGIKQIQEWLGHSNFNTTADIYSHLDFKSKIELANKLGKALNFENSPSIKELETEIKNLKQQLHTKETALKTLLSKVC